MNNLIHLKKSDVFKKVIPSKIFESMGMKKTIILGVEGESQNIIKHLETTIASLRRKLEEQSGKVVNS